MAMLQAGVFWAQAKKVIGFLGLFIYLFREIYLKGRVGRLHYTESFNFHLWAIS